jgi:hypothetical protein
MRGYLYLQTHPEHPGLVRFLVAERRPDPDRTDAGASVRYIARFNDIDAARMHVQNALHRRLIDLDSRMYRTGLAEAIAVVEADNLSHEQVWIDPDLDENTLRQVGQLTEQGRARIRRWDRFWQTVGYFFLGFLFLRALGLI